MTISFTYFKHKAQKEKLKESFLYQQVESTNRGDPNEKNGLFLWVQEQNCRECGQKSILYTLKNANHNTKYITKLLFDVKMVTKPCTLQK